MTARYDAVADSYGTDGEDDVSAPAVAALLDLADGVDGQRVLDLACGPGLVARALARRGAIVVGLDLSDGLLDRARASEAASPLGVTYVRGDSATGPDLADASFDGCTCCFGLSDIDDLPGTCATVARVLRPGGWFVAAILHPCFPGAEGASASWPSDGTYYDERWWKADGERSTLRAVVGGHHRMLSTYLNTLVEHGFELEAVREPPEPSWQASRPAAAALPVYLVVRARRRPVR